MLRFWVIDYWLSVLLCNGTVKNRYNRQLNRPTRWVEGLHPKCDTCSGTPGLVQESGHWIVLALVFYIWPTQERYCWHSRVCLTTILLGDRPFRPPNSTFFSLCNSPVLRNHQSCLIKETTSFFCLLSGLLRQASLYVHVAIARVHDTLWWFSCTYISFSSRVNSYSASRHNWCTVVGDGGCRVGEVRAGTASPMPDHKGFKLQ